jgi:hypothetical protein
MRDTTSGQVAERSEREERGPAILPCEGACPRMAGHPVATPHHFVGGVRRQRDAGDGSPAVSTIYECSHCGCPRVWGCEAGPLYQGPLLQWPRSAVA